MKKIRTLGGMFKVEIESLRKKESEMTLTDRETLKKAYL